MDDIFIRELVIFAAILVVFVGTVPMMIKGHYAESIEAAEEAVSADDADGAGQTRGMNKRRKARERDANKGKKT